MEPRLEFGEREGWEMRCESFERGVNSRSKGLVTWGKMGEADGGYIMKRT